MMPSPPWLDPAVRASVVDEARRVGEVPLLPGVALEAMAMAGQPDVPIRRIASILAHDAALAAHLLRVANSPLYGSGPRIARLPEALVRLGVQGLRQMLYAAAARRVLSVSGRPALSARMQTRAYAVAVGASAIGGAISADPDGSFVAGLLHDVGWAVVYGLAARSDSRLPAACRDDEHLDEIAEHLHQEVGSVLAEQWNLPPQVVAAIGYHHDPGAAMTGSQMAHVVAAAVRLCDTLHIEPFDPVTGPIEEDVVVRRLGLATEPIDRVRRRVLAELDSRA